MKAGECAVPRYVSCFGKRSIGLPPGRKKYESRDVCKDRRQGGAVEGVRPEEGVSVGRKEARTQRVTRRAVT